MIIWMDDHFQKPLYLSVTKWTCRWVAATYGSSSVFISLNIKNVFLHVHILPNEREKTCSFSGVGTPQIPCYYVLTGGWLSSVAVSWLLPGLTHCHLRRLNQLTHFAIEAATKMTVQEFNALCAAYQSQLEDSGVEVLLVDPMQVLFSYFKCIVLVQSCERPVPSVPCGVLKETCFLYFRLKPHSTNAKSFHKTEQASITTYWERITPRFEVTDSSPDWSFTISQAHKGDVKSSLLHWERDRSNSSREPETTEYVEMYVTFKYHKRQ